MTNHIHVGEWTIISDISGSLITHNCKGLWIYTSLAQDNKCEWCKKDVPKDIQVLAELVKPWTKKANY